jgi:hypothetical protein
MIHRWGDVLRKVGGLHCWGNEHERTRTKTKTKTKRTNFRNVRKYFRKYETYAHALGFPSLWFLSSSSCTIMPLVSTRASALDLAPVAAFCIFVLPRSCSEQLLRTCPLCTQFVLDFLCRVLCLFRPCSSLNNFDACTDTDTHTLRFFLWMRFAGLVGITLQPHDL